MNYLVAIVIFLLGGAGALAYALHEPFIFLVTLMFAPTLVQSMPWGLAMQQQDDDPEDAVGDYQGTSGGFTGEVQSRK